MKKIFLMMAAMACVGAAMTSCEDNTDPKAQRPIDNNFLNTPPTANYTYDLSSTATVTLTCSQPGYDVATIPTYAVQVSLDPNFAGTPAEWCYNGPTANPLNYTELVATTNKTTIDIAARDLADAINACRGFTDLNQFSEPGYVNYEGPVYLRLRSFFANANDDVADLYTIVSNIIKLSNVIAYPTLRQPGYIYLVGAPSGWTEPSASNMSHYQNYKLFEADDQIDSKIYSATFDIAAGQFQLRFYTDLTGWDADSWGAQEADSPVDIAMNENGIYQGAITQGKGSYQIPDWAGGKVRITVNLNAKTVEFQKVD